MSKLLEFPARKTQHGDDSQPAPGLYTPAEAARIARVPLHRLRAWQHEGIIFPTLFATDIEGKESAGYTFETVVYLRLLRMLREESIPLVRAVEAVKHLRERFGPPGRRWEKARIFVQGSDVFVHSKDEWDVTVPTRSGQKAATALLGDEFAQLRARADALLIPRQFWPTVEIDPEVRSGLPVIRGTTMPTAVPYAMRRRGESLRRIQTAYPHLSMTQIKGAIAFEKFLDAEAA